jgi:vancomycin resistance protein YoaR
VHAALAGAITCASFVAPAASRAADPTRDATVAPDSLAAGDSTAAGVEEFPVTLGAFSTTLIGSLPNRTQNIRLAAAALDGLVLEPGAELSFNHVVGPRTAERGYRVAPVILREVRQLQLGGGICQVASTLFDAGLLAGLTPSERHRHSSPVDYVEPGEDATIAWGAIDLRMTNDLSQRVRLRVQVVGGTLAARWEGETPLDGTYELETRRREVPASSDRNLPGREIELYRVHRRDDGDVEREFVHRDLYPSARMADAADR